jgi:ABC-type transport system involved in multi-copper enzyme maturation permease subunit
MIKSVSKYESKLLTRSWFFRIFTILAILILGILNLSALVMEDSGGLWGLKAIPSNIPYFNLLFLNAGQAVIAIFLASDFLKRDRKLDTSEVFYVRPLSNATYVFGKIWGNLRVFLILNLIIMGVSLLFTFMSPGIKVDWAAYVIYFFLISIPTLVYIIGLSIFLMLVLRNQALTFIILLGYIGLTLFYLSNKFYYVFDYMAFYLPLMKSSIAGFTNLGAILTHRAIYLFAGLACIFFTIFLFKRLPNSSRSNYPWVVLGICMLAVSGMAGYRHITSILNESNIRTAYTEINNRYVHTPKMTIEQYDINVTQHPTGFSAGATLTGIALQTSSTFTFCLNPGLQVLEVTGEERRTKSDGVHMNESSLVTRHLSPTFERDRQIILVNFGRDIAQGDTVTFTIRYSGRVDGRFCYLDIPEEVLRQTYTYAMFNSDKQYSFQTSDYLLFTPETYWYPRPGTAYSNASADWQQSYFSRFNLTVKPLPGLIPLSQGDGTDDGNGLFTFAPGYPVQAISLAVGKYLQKSLDADSMRFNIWCIEGHDYFTAAFDSIADTIPVLVQNMKEGLERRYKLDYPFRTFSVIEVPAQFYCYPHAWSQAQEAVQPGMVFFPEKGWLFDQMDVHKRVKNQKKWAKWNGQDITDNEAQMRAFNDAIRIFTQPEGSRNYSDVGRGQSNVTTSANPYFQFPQLYNFRYNIFSAEWPVANRIVELYLQDKSDNTGWERDLNGISNNEKTSLLMEKQSFKDLLANVEYRDLLDNMISLRANRLFAQAEINIGVSAFRDSVYAALRHNTFRNLQFEKLLNNLGAVGHVDIKQGIAEWTLPTPLPVYSIGIPEVTKVVNRGQEFFVLKMLVSNNSDCDGIVHLNIQVGRQDKAPDPRANRKIDLAAHQSKQLVSVWEDEPREVTVKTLISGNLPATVTQPVRNIRQERGNIPAKEGDFIVPASSFDVWGEVIVDNEDSLLFTLSKPAVVGLLPEWLDKTEVKSFKYSGTAWRRPIQWTATTNAGYYGKYIRSAYVIKGGNGSQTATWKVPVPAPGRYDAYYYVYRSDEMRNRQDAEYRFRVAYDSGTEDAYINPGRADGGWELLGSYYFGGDTVHITLTSESKLRLVTADAVKIVRR